MENNENKTYEVSMDITVKVKMQVNGADSFQASKDGARFLIGELSTESFNLDKTWDTVELKDIKVTDCRYLHMADEVDAEEEAERAYFKQHPELNP